MYRTTYFAGIVGQWLGYGATFITILILVNSFDSLDGWKGAEVMLLYGISVLSYAIGAAFFFTPCIELSSKLRSGEFDIALTKPIHPFLHEMFGGFNMGYVSHFTISLIIIIFSLRTLGHQLTMVHIAWLILMILGASLLQAAALIASSVLSFFTISNNPLVDFLLFDIKKFTNYPITIFPRGIQLILTFVLPFAFINYYPAAMLFNKPIPVGYPSVLPYLTPIVGIIFFIGSIILWNWGLKHYKSTGS